MRAKSGGAMIVSAMRGKEHRRSGGFGEDVFYRGKWEGQKGKAERIWEFLNWERIQIQAKNFEILKFSGYFITTEI